MPVPDVDIARVTESHGRLSGALDNIGDEQIRRPSLLPDWTVAHVLSHLARNADSHLRRTEAALRGDVIDQYRGGMEGRAREIDESARRPAAVIVEDVRTTAQAVEAAWNSLSNDTWVARSRDAGGLVRPLFELPARRWQEVEVHLVDLDIGITWHDWPDEFVLEWLPRTRERMAPALQRGPDPALTDPREELAWLYGRLSREDLPPVPPWG